MATMADSSAIRRLSCPTASRMRASLLLPSLPRVLSELAQNALDAGATRIDAWVSVTPGAEGVRLEDNGTGIPAADMALLGAPHSSSKELNAANLAPTETYGFRGEAIAAIAALSLVEVSSRVSGSASFSKVIKNGETLYSGPAKPRAEVARSRGTTVAVRQMYNAMPVRQAALRHQPPAATLTACKRALEAVALVHPRVRWALWDDRPGGPRQVFVLHGGQGTSELDVFRALYGAAGVERVQKVHAAAGRRRADGFISLEGAVTKAHQHLYINGYPLDACELHATITQRFAKSTFATSAPDITEDARRVPRRLERFPVYLLNLTLPPDEVDAAYSPDKGTLGYGNSKVLAFADAVVDDFLKRQGFVPKRAREREDEDEQQGEGESSRNTTASPEKRERRPGKSLERDERTPAAAEPVAQPRPPLGTPPPPLHQNPDWIANMLQGIDTGVLPIRSNVADAPPSVFQDIQLPSAALSSARVLRQVDRKFVACVLSTPAPALVVFDQHAADERVAVEALLDSLCWGFARSDLATRELETDSIRVVLTRAEGEALSTPSVRQVLRRWGIELGEAPTGAGDYLQVSVVRVPALLERLARKGGEELTRLLRVYLPLVAESMGEMEALLASLDTGNPGDPSAEDTSPGTDDALARVQRWMPAEILELANSKACRGAIMFEDRLDVGQCERLVTRLAGTRAPWVCAHGRPTCVPLRVLNARPAESKRAIDWGKWKLRHM